MAYKPSFFKNLQVELTAKKMWEFTDEVKDEIWKEDMYDNLRKEGYKNNNETRYGWQIQAEPIIKGFENNIYDQLSSDYIVLRFAYNFWKQYETEWNKKYKDCE